MSLCDGCQAIIGKIFDAKTYDNLKQNSTKIPLTNRIIHKSCVLCSLVSVGPYKVHELGIEHGLGLLQPQSDAGVDIACIGRFYGERSQEEVIRAVAELTSGAFLNGDVAGVLLGNSGSSDSFELVGGWLRTCQQHHVECMKTLEGELLENELKLPTRVLYIGSADGGLVKLVETHGSYGRWAALSHCWGNRQPICTTRDNLQKHTEGIPLSDLPSTFLDAIMITRSLGLEYLWIDTLCIVQRDPDDWKREASKMGQVYEHAEIVIAAAGSHNAYEGCFVDLPKGNLVELPYIKKGAVAGQFFAKRCFGPDLIIKNAFHPLSDRAWTIQERVLSRRTVYYTSNGIWWNCRHFGATCFRHDGVSLEDIQLTPRQQSWTGLLDQYLSCALSVCTDNLQAVEGIASRMACARPDRYYHGCWMNDLPEQLIWYGNAPRPPELKGRPSWSWSSTAIGKITFLDNTALKYTTNLCGPFKQYLLNGLQVRCLVHSPVTLAQPTKPFQIGDLPENGVADSLLYLIINNENRTVGVAIMDDASWLRQKVHTSSNLSLVFLVGSPNRRWRDGRQATSDQKSLNYGLVTSTPQDRRNVHSRIGFATVYSQAYAEQASGQDIILV